MTRLTPFTTSWDDGSEHDARLGGLLADFGLRGTFYATTGPGGARTIDDSALTALAREHELGNHGRSHVRFTELGDVEIGQELEWGARELARFGSASRLVAPPFGKIDFRVAKVARRLGYVIRTAPILSTARSTPYRFEPTFMFYPQPWSVATRNFVRRASFPAVPLVFAWGIRKDFRRRVMDLLSTAVRRGHIVHMWGHSADIEHLHAWDLLEDVLAHVTSLPIRPGTNGDFCLTPNLARL
jgi:peptidoglycan-N-acetylglucosamine deacetylase